VLTLVQSNKLTLEKVNIFLDSLSSNQLTIDDLQVAPDDLLVEYLKQKSLGLTLIEQIHISSFIKSPIRSYLIDIKDNLSPKKKETKTATTTKQKKKRAKSIQNSTNNNKNHVSEPVIVDRPQKYSDSKKVITDSYEILEVIGSGGFSEVRKGKNIKNKDIVAIKIIEKKKTSRENR